MQDDAERRVAFTQRVKTSDATRAKPRTLSQAELIAEALETEELNRASLRAFYAAEAERRDFQALWGNTHYVPGPKLRFLSRGVGIPPSPKIEDVTVEIDATPALELTVPSAATPVPTTPTPTPLTLDAIPQIATEDEVPNTAPATPDTPAQVAEAADKTVSSTVVPPSPKATTVDANAKAKGKGRPSKASVIKAPTPPPPQVGPYTRNYLILEDFRGNYSDMLTAVFGEHVDWARLKVLPTRQRALRAC